MLVYAPAALLSLVFCVSVLHERRKFSNAVVLGLAVLCALGALLYRLVGSGSPSVPYVVGALVALGAVALLVLVCFLFLNGVRMLRKEGRSPSHLLSLLAAFAVLGVVALLVAAAVLRTPVLIGVASAAGGLALYFSFLFLCFVCYAFLYGRLRVRRKADFVVVLGSGLIGGTTVPPLLASRLKRGREVHERLSRRGGSPVLITSGGQGPDEKLPESHAMADHLVAEGFPKPASSNGRTARGTPRRTCASAKRSWRRPSPATGAWSSRTTTTPSGPPSSPDGSASGGRWWAPPRPRTSGPTRCSASSPRSSWTTGGATRRCA